MPEGEEIDATISALVTTSLPTQSSLPPTQNTSPLAPQIQVWYDKLTRAHHRFCKAPDTCCGLRPLLAILAEQKDDELAASGQHRCTQAQEAELLLPGIYFGFRILTGTQHPAEVPIFEVANYPSSELSMAAITATIEKELQEGLLRLGFPTRISRTSKRTDISFASLIILYTLTAERRSKRAAAPGRRGLKLTTRSRRYLYLLIITLNPNEQ